MDREIVQIGAVPQDTDLLNTNLNAYIALSKLAAGILGTTTQLNGLTVTQTASPSMAVLIAPGEIYQLANIDTSAYGSLPTNSSQILKQGINLTSTTTTTMSAPVTVGQSVNYLIEFQLNETDTGSTVLPYYNSTNPTQTFDGPNNSVQPNLTVRQDAVGYQIKAGTPATTGSQTTPSPDSGYVGGWVVTVAHGDTTILNSAIALYPSAPYIVANDIEQIIQTNSYLYALDTGAANALVATLTPALTAYTTGMTVFIKAANNNTSAATININGLGIKNIKLMNGNALTGSEILTGQIIELNYDGTSFQLQNPANIQVALQGNGYIYALDTGSTNALAVALTPALTAYTTGMTVFVKAAHTNTSAATININSLGVKNIKLMNGNALTGNEILIGQIIELNYDGTNFQIQNSANIVTTGQLQSNSFIYALDSGTINTLVATLSPALTAYTTGMTVFIKLANTNSGASTININGLGVKNIKLMNGNALSAGNLRSGTIAELNYDGTNFQLQNPANLTIGGVNGFNLQILTASSGTYTPTTGMVEIRVRAVGPGGGSGSITNAGAYAVSQGGNSGNGMVFTMTAAQVGASLAYTIGSVGTAGTAGGAGGNAGDTVFGDWTIRGGKGGAAQVGVAVNTISTPTASNSANVVGTGTVITNILGQIASIGMSLTSPLLCISSLGGSSMLSIYNQEGIGMTGNFYISATDVAGIAATNGYGNGGTGAIALNSASTHNGGAGGAGLIIVEEFLSV